MDSPISFCFVCLGNICRSPTAEGVFLHLVRAAGLDDGSIIIDSAGTSGYHDGAPADYRSREHAARRGYGLPSRSRQFQVEDFARFDYVLAMDNVNLEDLTALRRHAPPWAGRLQLFRDFDPTAPPGSSVPDPYYGGDRGFEEVLDQCERASRGLLQAVVEDLRRRRASSPF
jgi:protein-tyrosine phosphatase